MANQLKQAFINAGLVTKKDLEREKVQQKHMSKNANIRDDQIRIVCEVCTKTAPDVERYRHTNRRISGKEWICLRCADEYQIDDNCRETNVSTDARAKRFIRQYGRTKRF